MAVPSSFTWDNVRQTEVGELAERLCAREPVALSRWGDWEWKAVLGARRSGYTRDGHPYGPEVTKALRCVLIAKPPYRLGMQEMSLTRLFDGKVAAFVESHGLTDFAWHQNDVFYHCLQRPELHSQWVAFLAALRGLPGGVIGIGPEHAFDPIRRLAGCYHYIKTPKPGGQTRNVFEMRRQLADMAYDTLHRRATAAVLVSAGATANLIIDDLYHRLGGDRHFLLDVGSVWDAYAGVKSRSWIKDGHGLLPSK